MSEPARSDGAIDLDQDICVHIFTVSSAMVGVCLTVVGIIRIVISIQKVDTFADDLLALNALLFLVSCLAAYWALRTRSSRRMQRLERAADGVFLAALALTVGNCAFITYAMSAW
ncbi:MAG: hypothetical protein ACREYD_15710 [Casimicrobiaceae bacterium]